MNDRSTRAAVAQQPDSHVRFTGQKSVSMVGKSKGLFTELFVPLRASGEIADREFTLHVQRMARVPGIAGVVVNAYAHGLDSESQRVLVELAVAAAPRGFPVIAGISQTSRSAAIAHAEFAAAAGVDGLLVHPALDPLAARREGASRVVESFAEIAESTTLPLIVYQYPERTGLAYSLEILRDVADLEGVIAIKSSTCDSNRFRRERESTRPAVAILTGYHDFEMIKLIVMGADGAMISASNILPEVWGRVFDRLAAGDLTSAVRIFKDELSPISYALRGDDLGYGDGDMTAVVRAALEMMGTIEPMPTVTSGGELNERELGDVRAALVESGVTPRAG